MTPKRSLNRRSFMLRVAGGIAAQGGALIAFTGGAKAVQVTDHDPTDQVGQGRGGGGAQGNASGYSDSDSGAGADPSGRGRRGAPSGVTDSDSGAGADRVGHGRGTAQRNAYQDNDNADPAGNARRPRDDYVDCERTRDRLREVEREIELAEWDNGQLAQAQADLARARQVYAEMLGNRPGSYAQHQEIESLITRHGVSCQHAGEAHCISRLEDAVAAAIRGRQNRPRLYGERYRLQEELRRGCGPAYQP